jgi:methionyl-tRNA synthetase
MTTPSPIDHRMPWYITTAIPFVNARPHLGFALEVVLTDALARYHRMKGDDTRFLTGTDENSLKNVQAAEKEGIPTEALVARNAALFHDLKGVLDLSFDDFIRTSAEERHLAGVRKLWEACDRSGDIYRKSYSGLYCVGCEQYYAESELVDGLCPEHRTPPELVEEENYFFRLSRYTEILLALIESGQLRVEPEKRRNEVLSFLRMGLADFSISRSQARAHGWGVPVPGDPDQVMYVWFDALGNYITALDYATDGALYRRYWLENPHRVHVIGKGILRFHAVYWPAMLLSAGVPLPTTIFVHGYVTVDGEKLSKSLGNAIDPVTLTEAHGTDAVRYYLLRHIRSTDDGDYTTERFIRAYNADLADQIGNLLSRTVGMVTRYYDGVVPAAAASAAVGSPEPEADRQLIDTGTGLAARVDAAMEQFLTHEALAAIWDLVDVANKYVVTVEPWTLAKARKNAAGSDEAGVIDARLGTVLYNLAEALRLAALFAQPFIPQAAAGIAAQLGIDLAAETDWQAATRWGGYPAGTALQAGGVLFPKIEIPIAEPA